MIVRPIRHTGRLIAGAAGAVFMVGLLHVGILQLNRGGETTHPEEIHGAIRLAQQTDEPPVPEERAKTIKETPPPEKLPRTFSSKQTSRPQRPAMTQAPSFSAELHPSVKGGMVMPALSVAGATFTLAEVDTPPRVVRTVPLKYPLVAKRSNIEGYVIVNMLVTAEGKPEQLSIQAASPAGIFEESALEAARQSRFTPGKLNGQAVDTWVQQPFEFKVTQ
ncbi:energy transducer TonB [Oleidesulfovibrio alaskensis]|jgi:protein TonB|uniref:energy transducer TonB n=1 Tax=Oleidesulfovibrio alaskensis TaxID=58180 RepID=UPI000428CF85|nr:energy transducer TonB [Oleidesulfovibrio alaskensis]MBL3581086.1 energy transducer TonB [Oleidesulfovibrio alaskensis]